ncbi:MAG: M61 family metallopeptidase, partial [Planctomycetes bacterium]|nr:M61 family metallopeptidase [Planctomycetota bacterium]
MNVVRSNAMRCGIIAALAVVCPAVSVVAQPDSVAVEYTIGLHEPQTQYVEMTATFHDLTGDVLDVHLPTWRPGRYVILDFAGTITGVSAESGDGSALVIEKTAKSSWRVDLGGSTQATIRYRVYANSLGDRTRHVDDSHAFLDGSSVFAYVKGRRDEPVTLTVEPFDGWRVTTGLSPSDESTHTYAASGYDELIDCPLEIGTHELREFDVAGVPHELAIWGRAHHDLSGIEGDIAKVIEAQHTFWGGFPYERYVLLLHIGSGGGATEHRNSAILQVGRDAFERPKAYRDFLRLVSHEVFHAWNVKALRPAGISPYRYDRENYTKLLWVSEGSTSYYADIILVRAGLMTPDVYLKKLGERIDEFRRRPGRHVQSLEASSFDAWIKFNKATADEQNSTVSFYAKGALVSWMLDFELRLRTKNRVSYDTVLASMYRDFPLAGGGFTPEDLLATIERLAASDFGAFWRDYISGTRDLDLESCASIAGLSLVLKADREDEDDEVDSERELNDEDGPIEVQPDLGIKLRDAHGRWVVDFVRSDGPAYQAGVIAGDELLA